MENNERKIVDYVIVNSSDVMDYIKKGYVLYGNPVVLVEIFYAKQALIKYE